jgi:hypothetical protein
LFKLSELPFRHTRRETRRFQDGPDRMGRPGTSWFLSWCLSDAVAGGGKGLWSHITNFFLRSPVLEQYQLILIVIFFSLYIY